MAMPETPDTSIGQRLQSLPRQWLYIILIICASVPLFFSLKVPGEVRKMTRDFYDELMKLKAGQTILIESDWTKSTRGESVGQFESLLKILMRKKVKFVIYGIDPQSPQVADDTVVRINEQEKAGYKLGQDYVNCGYFPNAEGLNQSLGTDLRKAFESRYSGGMRAIDTPVLKPYKKIEDIPLLVIVTASKSFNIAIERLNTKVRMLAMVTGVMVPESQVYYASEQIKGLSGGLKGVYDIETLMEKDFPGMDNKGKGMGYFPTLHVVLGLMILAVIIGNIGMFLARRRRAA